MVANALISLLLIVLAASIIKIILRVKDMERKMEYLEDHGYVSSMHGPMYAWTKEGCKEIIDESHLMYLSYDELKEMIK